MSETINTQVGSPPPNCSLGKPKRKKRKRRHRAKRSWSKACKRFRKGFLGAALRTSQWAGVQCWRLVLLGGVWLLLAALGLPGELVFDPSILLR